MKKQFNYFNLVDFDNRTTPIIDNFNKIVKQVTGCEDFKKCDNIQISKVFDHIATLDIIEMTNNVYVIVSEYYELPNTYNAHDDEFNVLIAKILATEKFKVSRGVIMTAVVNKSTDKLVSYNDEIDIVFD